MTFDEYQSLAMETRLPEADESYAVIGLSGEVGELHSLYAKWIRDRGDFPTDNVKKELGDILWFIAAIAQDVGLSLGEVAEVNINKLHARKVLGRLRGSGDDR